MPKHFNWGIKIYTFICSNQYTAVWSKCQWREVKANFDGKGEGAIVSEIVQGYFVSHWTHHRVPILREDNGSLSVHRPQ